MNNTNNGVTIWLTGLSGSGKSTIAYRLRDILSERFAQKAEILDGDVMRQILFSDLGFSKEDRDENVRRIGFVANLLTRNGIINIVASISPYRAARTHAKSLIGSFIEVYVNAPLSVCEERDVKRLYHKARQGLIRDFTGIDAPYEEPLNPDITCYTDSESVDRSVNKIIAYLRFNSYIK